MEVRESMAANGGSVTSENGISDGEIEVTVVDITKNNLTNVWPTIVFAIQNSSFVAVDLELSGLGDRSKLSKSSIDERYKALCDAATSRSVVSLGLACFQQVQSKTNGKEFVAHSFNIFLLCEEEYVVESQSLQFLVDHGFDFNKQYSCGIPYRKGIREGVETKPTIRGLFLEVVAARKPLVVHNGFIDLVFLYENLYTQLPSSLQTFIADLCEIFPAGVYDTKYISEFHARENFSFLEYIFKKCQYKNQSALFAQSPHVSVKMRNASPSQLQDQQSIFCSLPTVTATESIKRYLPNLCKTFQARGYCPTKTSCDKIHSIDLMIIDEDESQKRKQSKKKRKRKRKLNNDNDEKIDCKRQLVEQNVIGCESEMNSQGIKELESNGNGKKNEEDTNNIDYEQRDLPRMNGHRAGFDAFMTAYCFACYQTFEGGEGVFEWKNKVYLTAKDIPLNIMKSHFAKTSTHHQRIANMIFDR